MKTLFVSLYALLFFFFFACQEGSITDPVQENNTNHQSGKDYLSFFNSDILKLEGFTYDPVHESSSRNPAEIFGNVTYEHTLVIVDPMPPAPQMYVILNVTVDTDILVQCPNAERIWAVNQYFDEVVNLSDVNEKEVFIEKRFKIKNTCCGYCELFLRFKVTDESMNIESMWLRQTDSNYNADPQG